MMEPLTFRVDPRTRFPLVEVPGQDFALFWLPLTKVQIEYFLSGDISSRFDRAWYLERLRANPRVTFGNLAAQNLAQAFITDITFNEARVFSRWFGRNYDLPTNEEWHRALRIFETVAAHPAFVEQILALPDLHPRARLLVQACEKALPDHQRMRDLSGRRLSHQMMMSLGILEYVYMDTARTRCGACGSSLQIMTSGTPGQSTTMALRDPDQGDRMAVLGVRSTTAAQVRGTPMEYGG